MKAGLYRRLSVRKSTEDATDDSLDRQEADGRALARSKGWDVLEVYSDIDSAYWRPGRKPSPREGFERALTDLASGHIDALVFWKLDRLVRDHGDFDRLWRITLERNAVLASCKEPVDTGSPVGEAMVRMGVLFARLESQTIGMRVSAQRQQAAEHGRPNTGGPAPFGWMPDRVTPHPEQAAIIREVAERVLAGQALRAITADTNHHHGLRFVPASWRRILRAPRVAGMRARHGQIVNEHAWKPILDPDTWERVKATLPAKERSGRPPKHLLVGGIARCGECGRQLYSHPERGGLPRLVCAGPPEHRGCGRVSIRSRPLDSFVVEAVITALAGPRLTELLAGADAEQDRVAAVELERDRAALLELSADHYQRGLIGRTEFLHNRGPLQERIDQAERRVARRASRGVLTDLPRTREALEAAWERWTLDQRRTVLRLVLDSVVVHKAEQRGRRFDRSRVEVIWRV
jgi:site-specific DNA recombinase